MRVCTVMVTWLVGGRGALEFLKHWTGWGEMDLVVGDPHKGRRHLPSTPAPKAHPNFDWFKF